MVMSPVRSRGRHSLRRDTDDDGSVVEAVLIVPVLMVLVLVVIQFALWAHALQVVQLAASEGDRAARAAGSGPAVGVAQARAVTESKDSDLASSSVSGTVLPGDGVEITVTGQAVAIVPGLHLPVSSIEIGPIQEFRSSE
jgi:Flp pilus assembly protein TadG